MAAADFVVIGAGIVGLATARELKRAFPSRRVLILEKEETPGLHASTRNSGVLHSGIYYPPGTLKARVCVEGAREMADFCTEHRLPLNRLGKLLVPTRETDAQQLDLLETRAAANGIVTERIDERELGRLEPHVRSATGTALRVPGTSVTAPVAVVETLLHEVRNLGVEVRCGGRLESVDAARRTVTWHGTRISYGHAVNCAGVHADTVAHLFGAGSDYFVLPFRGGYWKLDPASEIRVRHLIYPVPDLRVPFLGVHTTTTIEGDVYLGPTATPAFGRESYRGLSNVRPGEATRITLRLIEQLIAGHDGFRQLAWQEAGRVTRRGFLSAARALLPALQSRHLLASAKAGIRPQLVSKRTGRLVMDFTIEQSAGVTHVLNAISPAFTCAFPLARLLVNDYITEPSPPRGSAVHATRER